MKTIQYAIDTSTGLVVSRVGSELAWPIMDYPHISCHLEKIHISEITAAAYVMLKWTRKIDNWAKDLHRKFWGFSLLKGYDMVTKKDFKAIAEIVKKHTVEHVRYPGNEIIKHGFTNDLVDYFATQNPRFDRQKFLDACGL